MWMTFTVDKGLWYEAQNIIKVYRSLSGVSLRSTREFEVFKAGSWITLGLHCDSQTCYRQKPAAKAFWRTYKGKNMLVTHIRSTLNPHQSIQECLECVWNKGGYRVHERGQEDKNRNLSRRSQISQGLWAPWPPSYLHRVIKSTHISLKQQAGHRPQLSNTH